MLWTAEKLADYLDLTERRIRQLRDMKILAERSKGLYEPFENIKSYIEYISGEKGAEGTLSLTQEKARLYAIKRQREELEFDEMRGMYHKTEEIETIVSSILLNFRAKLLSIPTAMAKTLADMNDPADVDAALDIQMREALEELSDLDFLASQESRE